MKIKKHWPSLVDIIGDQVHHYNYTVQEFIIEEVFCLVDNIIKFSNKPKVQSPEMMNAYLDNLHTLMDILFTAIDNRLESFEYTDQLVIINSILKSITYIQEKAIEEEFYELAANLKLIREYVIFYKI